MGRREKGMGYLRRHELGRAAEGARRTSIPHLFLAQSVISNFDVSVQCQQDVVEFEIAIDDAVFVKVFQCQADLCCVEPGNHVNLVHHILSPYTMNEKLTAPASFQTALVEYAASDLHR